MYYSCSNIYLYMYIHTIENMYRAIGRYMNTIWVREKAAKMIKNLN